MEHENDWSNWTGIISNYLKPSNARSWWQLINSIIPYFGLLVAMYYSMEISYWFTLALSIPTAGFMVRIFIIFHDCGHGSFFKSSRANQITGIITGWIVYTPYHRWHYEHQRHHQTVGNLDTWCGRCDDYDSWRIQKQYSERTIILSMVSKSNYIIAHRALLPFYSLVPLAWHQSNH